MKLFRITAAFLLCLLCCGFNQKWQPAPINGWRNNVTSTLEIARGRQRCILVLKTNLSTDHASRRMVREVFQDRNMRRYLWNNLETVCLDFSANANMPFSQMQHNLDMAEQLKIPENFPALVILNPQGQVIARKSGYISTANCLAFFKEIIPDKSPFFVPTMMWSSAMNFSYAKQNNSKILLLINNSTASGVCAKIQNEVISAEEFYDAVKKKKLCLTYMDTSPRQSGFKARAKSLEEMQKLLRIPINVPAFALIDPVRKKVIALRSGPVSLKECLSFLNNPQASATPPRKEIKKNKPPLKKHQNIPPELQAKLKMFSISVQKWQKGSQTGRSLNCRLRAGEKLLVTFTYTLPRQTNAQIFVKAGNNFFTPPSPFYSGTGKFVAELVSNRPAVCQQLQIYIRFAGSNEELPARRLPCSLVWSANTK